MTVALVFPPGWYFCTAPADLSVPAGHLRANGVQVRTWDLSGRVRGRLFRDTSGWRGLRRPGGSVAAWQEATRDLKRRARALSTTHGIGVTPRRLFIVDGDEGDVAVSLRAALDRKRNPALAVLVEAVGEIVAARPSLVALALVHPGQRPHLLALARLLAHAAPDLPVVIYGDLEDQLSPLDVVDVLVDPGHCLWSWVSGVVLGESPSALLALARGEMPPNLLRRGEPLPRRHLEDLETLSLPDWSDTDPRDMPFSTPVVDLRLGRGCAWGRCAFCAIQAHQEGYRTTHVDKLVAAMARAHAQLGVTTFRIRDDLVTPVQLRRLAEATSALSFQPRWSARARFSRGLTRDVLRAGREGGLGDLWLGLESAVPEVRNRMDKGVDQGVVERVLDDAHGVGVRLRTLCLIGFPGERPEQAEETVAFLARNTHRIASASITPFQLMARSPMAGRPEAFGITRCDDPVPASRRLRHRLAFVPSADQQVIAGRLSAMVKRLAVYEARAAGPTPTHDLLAGPVL